MMAPYRGTTTFLRYQAGTGIMCSVGGTAALARRAVIVAGQWYHTALTYDGFLHPGVSRWRADRGVSGKVGPSATRPGTAWLIGAQVAGQAGRIHGPASSTTCASTPARCRQVDITRLANFLPARPRYDAAGFEQRRSNGHAPFRYDPGDAVGHN